MTSVKKKQHYVPKFYLKFFAESDNKFSVYDFHTRRVLPNPVHYGSQCHKKYFYGEDGIWEDRLSQKEGQWASTCKKVIKGDIITDEDALLLKEFVIYQKQRTNNRYNHARSEREAILEECTRMIYKNHGWEYDDTAKELCMRRAAEGVTPAENVEMAGKMLRYVEDLSLLIVHYKTCSKLLTTDSPVITLNPFMEFMGFGYGNVGIAFIMPLTPRHLIILYDDHLYTRYKGRIYHESQDENEVMVINRYELIHAEYLAFSGNGANFDVVTKEIMNWREKEIERNQMQFLGPENTGRLMIIQAEGTRNYYELPYLILPREYKRIPYNCREAIPRHFQKEWGDKLAMKYLVLRMANKTAHDSDTKKLLPPRGDLRLGCKRMEDLAKRYWKSRGYSV